MKIRLKKKYYQAVPTQLVHIYEISYFLLHIIDGRIIDKMAKKNAF